MPSSVVHLAIALLLAAGLLGRFYSRSALGVLALIVILPELDTVVGFVLAGAFVLTGSFLVVAVAHYLVNALTFVVHEAVVPAVADRR